VKKIAILGPESTGKTNLAQALSAHYNARWIPEYAREYIYFLNKPYTFADVETIARHQIKEFAAVDNESDGFVFFDTELIITKVWFLHCYKTCPQWLLDAVEQSRIDLYLLCRPDIPWQPDPLRENEHLRDYFYKWYKREVELLKKPFIEISGLGNERLTMAVKGIEKNELS